MKKTVKLYAAKGKGDGCDPYIYDEKLIPEGCNGVRTSDGAFPSDDQMLAAQGLFELMGINFPDEAAFELEITVTGSRKIGWYPVLLQHNSEQRIFYWNGEVFKSHPYFGATTWYPDEIKSVLTEEPITPDPFKGVNK